MGCFKKIRSLGLLIVVLAAVISGCGDGAKPNRPPHLAADYSGTPARVGGLQLPGRVQRRPPRASTAKDGFQPRFWPGVNLGSTVPGR